MSYLPCKNPNCKSYGQPHPQCKCYDGYAKGGTVGAYCDSSKPHLKGCQYFAEGGQYAPGMEVPPELLPDDSHAPDLSPGMEVPPELLPKEEAAPEISKGSPEPQSGDEVPMDMLRKEDQPDEYRYKTPGQKGLAAVEGAVKGLIPGSPWLEAHNPLILIPEGQEMASEKNQAKRAEQNPEISTAAEGIATIGSMASGLGLAGAINKGVGAIGAGKAASKALVPVAEAGAAATNRLAKMAPDFFKGFITNGLIQGNDEISKAMLGQGDPEAPVAAALIDMGAAGLFGGLGATVASGVVKPKLNDLANQKLGDKLTAFMIGATQAAKEPEIESRVMLSDYGPYRAGMKWFDKLAGGIAGKGATAGATLGGYEGYHDEGLKGIPKGVMKGAMEGYVAGIIGKKAVTATGKYIVPMVFKMMGNGNVQNVLNTLNHAESVGAGARLLENEIDAIFKGGTQQMVNYGSSDRDKLKDFIAKGGITQNIQQQIYDDNAPTPQYAEGGEVNKPQGIGTEPGVIPSGHDPIATNFPDQNLLLQAAKGRVSNYLQAQQPQKHAPKLPFDDEPDTKEAEKSYNRALDIALKPASVLGHIQKGTLEPEHMKHMNAMYPEVVSQLQKKVTAKIAEAQVKGEKPSYKVRQGLSMLMGTPLSGEMTPQNIQAAQATFQPSQPQPAPAPPPKKKGTSALTKSDQSFMTADQSRQKRLQKV